MALGVAALGCCRPAVALWPPGAGSILGVVVRRCCVAWGQAAEGVLVNHYEVEQKFWVDDLDSLRRQLVERGVALDPPLEESDLYFAHPARDFVQTDEALRIRNKQGKVLLTYKGPKLDLPTKTRHEIELPLGEGEPIACQWRALLEMLGFRPVAEVRKRREKGRMPHGDRIVEISLDDVAGLGTFAELEVVVDADELARAQTVILTLAGLLGLSKVERRSYLGLLLERLGRGGSAA